MKRTAVQIDGLTFYVVGSDDPERVRGLGKTLTEEIEKIRGADFRLNHVQVLTLTALNILNEKADLMEELNTAAGEGSAAKALMERSDTIEEMQQALDDRNEALEKVTGAYEELKAKAKDWEKEKSRLEMDLMDLREKLKREKARGEKALADWEKEKDKVLEAQKKVVDLQREWEAKRDRDEA